MKTPINSAFSVLRDLHLAGLLNPLTYVLGCHVLHAMQRNNVRQIMLSASGFGNAVLLGEDGALIAGAVQGIMHTKEGAQVYSVNDVSPKYVSALKELHFTGILLNDVMESNLNNPDAALYHFSGDPCFSPGTHWTEKTPIVYRMQESAVSRVEEHIKTFLSQQEQDRTLINAA